MSTRQKIIEYLMDHPERVSGQELSSRLNITRAAVWKQMHELMEQGYEIDALPHEGYLLLSVPDRMDSASLYFYNNKQEFLIYPSTDSTNILAKKLAVEGASHGTVVLAHEQTAGKGRLGRTWISPPGGVYLSVILRSALPPQKVPLVTLAAALAVTDAIEEVCGFKADIKWPNDIQAHGKKLCGILTEAGMGMDGVEWIVVGMGINVNAGAEVFIALPDATSLLAQTGIVCNRTLLAARLATLVVERAGQLEQGNSEELLDLYRQRCVTLHKEVSVTQSGLLLNGFVEDIDTDGALLLRTTEGMRTLYAGDVTLKKG